MKLSVLMPAYNEKDWIEEISERVLQQEVPGVTSRELIIVDDGSTDGTGDVIRALADRYPNQVVSVFHDRNRGKGAAVRSALDKATGEVCIIQDADMEYDPADYALVLEPIIEGRADCVYGSRFQGAQSKRVLFFWHCVGNKFITFANNMFTNMNFTDIETCYKAFLTKVIKSITLRSNDFCFEIEITAKIARMRCRVYEVGISYSGRTYSEGKKVTWVDGVKAVVAIIRYRLFCDGVSAPCQKSKS